MIRLAGLCILLCAHSTLAESGRTAAPFLQRAMGARASSMGSAFVAVQGSIDSLQYNPAAIGTLQNKTVTSSYLKGFAGATHGYFGYAHPTPLGSFAGSFLYFNAGKISLNLSDGTRGSVTAEKNTAWTASYGKELFAGLHLGATYRFVRLNLAQTASATTSQGDFGALWKTPLKGVSIGAAYQYAGPNITFESAGDPPPTTLRYGIAFRFPDVDVQKIDPSVDLDAFDMTLAVDGVRTLHERHSPRLGLELGLTPAQIGRIAMRTGWVIGREAEGFTFGLGFAQGRFGFDYAFGSSLELGHLQHFSISARF